MKYGLTPTCSTPEAILHYAKEQEADAIALSTHLRGVSRFLIGSVADKVAECASLAANAGSI
jgi:nucleotide-binding universal stress UspA family protein